MPEPTTLDKVREILIDQLGVDSGNITESSTFNELGADSLDSVELVMAFEDEFGIQFDNVEEEKYTEPTTTVADCVRVIDEKLAAKK